MIMETSLHGIWKSLKSSSTTYLIQLATIEAQDSLAEHPTILESLEKFQKLFVQPFGLPLPWVHDHAIHFVEGIMPPNIRPYRYPHY